MNTPRTDADSFRISSPKAEKLGSEYVVVRYEVAEALERELSACKLDLEAEERGQDNLRSLLAAKSAECQRLREALVNFRAHVHVAAYALECNGRQETADSLRRVDEQARAALQETQP